MGRGTGGPGGVVLVALSKGVALDLPPVPAAADEIRRVVTVFRELREGRTGDGRTTLKSPSGTLSIPPAAQGWQRRSLRTLRPRPRTAPCTVTDSRA